MSAPSRPALVLLGLLALAAALRFTGLGWGLRQAPHADEAAFVENAARMLREGSLDHGFYEYPGLFLYLLVPAQAPAGGSGPPAYLAARALVAAFGVLSVALAFVLGRRLAGDGAGLTAAALLAVSPLEVQTAHMVRPDVVLGSLALLALLAQRRLGESPRGDALAGAALGLAASVKFTGLLLVPSHLLARALRPGRRGRGLAVAVLAAVVVGLLLTPYAWLAPAEYWKGVRYQVGFHYAGPREGTSYLAGLGTLLGEWLSALGILGAGLALAGLALAWRERREWAPLVAFPAVTVLIHASAHPVWPRFLVPSLGVLALLAGFGLSRLTRGRPALALPLAAAALAQPLWVSAEYSLRMARPTAQDDALDWIEANLPAGSLVLETRVRATPGGGRPGASLGLDPARHEVRFAGPDTPPRDLAFLARHADLVVTGPGGGGRNWQAPLRTLHEARGPLGEAVLRLRAVDPAERPRYDTVPLASASLSASANAEALPLLGDGSPATSWTAGAAGGEQWLAARFGRLVTLGRLELVLPGPPLDVDPVLRVFLEDEAGTRRGVETVSLRPETRQQLSAGRPRSLVLLFRPTSGRALRLERADRGRGPWSVAELVLGSPATPPSAAAPSRPRP